MPKMDLQSPCQPKKTARKPVGMERVVHSLLLTIEGLRWRDPSSRYAQRRRERMSFLHDFHVKHFKLWWLLPLVGGIIALLVFASVVAGR